MRCHFLKDGHIQQIMGLPYLSAEEAVEQSRQMFEAVASLFDDIEVWDGDTLIYWMEQLPPPDE